MLANTCYEQVIAYTQNYFHMFIHFVFVSIQKAATIFFILNLFYLVIL